MIGTTLKLSLLAVPMALSLIAVSPASPASSPAGVNTESVQQSITSRALLESEFFPDDSSATTSYVEADSPQDAVAKLDRLDQLRAAGINVATMAKVNYGPCKIVAEGFHARKSGDYQVGGFKSTTYCTKRVSKITHSSQARHKRLIWWIKGGLDISDSPKIVKSGYYKKTPYASVFTQKNHSISCKSTKGTTWSGRTLGTIDYNGKTYYADACAPIQKNVPCRP